MRKPITSRVVAVVLLTVALMVGWFMRSSSGGSTAPVGNVRSVQPVAPTTRGAGLALLETGRTSLVATHNSGDARLILAELRRHLDSLPPEETSREIQTFLATGLDAATGLDITIEAGGGLGDASSLRVFLLDYLGRIDRVAAGMIAARVLSGYTTPDEWAVSLRNFAWAYPGPDSEAFLQAKTRQLLGNKNWASNPSTGYLEAFDAIVYAHGTALVPELATLVRDRENRATAHAAYLTLDRLTINEPAIMLKQLADKPELLQGREQTRANFFARADVRDPAQRALLEQYILDPARDPTELATFAGLYPNANFMISPNLLTQVTTPTGAEIAAHDRAALAVVEQWLADSRFERVGPQLLQIRERLRTFVRPAGGSSS